MELLDKLMENLFTLMIIETRIAAVFSMLFFLNKEWVPPKISLIFSLILSLFIIQTMPIDLSLRFNNFGDTVILLIQQFFLGIATGIIVNIFVECFMGFGQIISLQAGLGFSTLYIPGMGNITSLANFFFILSILIFFQLNGHLVFIKMLINSILTLPKITSLNENLIKEIILFFSTVFKGALMLSVAIVFVLMLSNFTLALVTKFTAQLNIFSIGINITLILCFLIIYLTFDFIIENGEILCNEILLFIKNLLK